MKNLVGLFTLTFIIFTSTTVFCFGDIGGSYDEMNFTPEENAAIEQDLNNGSDSDQTPVDVAPYDIAKNKDYDPASGNLGDKIGHGGVPSINPHDWEAYNDHVKFNGDQRDRYMQENLHDSGTTKGKFWTGGPGGAVVYYGYKALGFNEATSMGAAANTDWALSICTGGLYGAVTAANGMVSNGLNGDLNGVAKSGVGYFTGPVGTAFSFVDNNTNVFKGMNTGSYRGGAPDWDKMAENLSKLQAGY